MLSIHLPYRCWTQMSHTAFRAKHFVSSATQNRLLPQLLFRICYSLCHLNQVIIFSWATDSVKQMIIWYNFIEMLSNNYIVNCMVILSEPQNKARVLWSSATLWYYLAQYYESTNALTHWCWKCWFLSIKTPFSLNFL